MGITNEAARVYLKKAEENLRAATVLAKEKHFNAAVTRAYYSSFQIAYQKMLRNGVVTLEEHDSLHRKAEDFISKNARLSFSKFHELLGYRRKADYSTTLLSEGECNYLKGRSSSLFQELKDIFAYDL